MAPAEGRAPSTADASPTDKTAGTGLAAGDLEDAAQTLDAPPAGDNDSAPTESSTPPGTERARLVALNMALSGTSRTEADRHLREELQVDDPSPILDEVYARAQGEG
jgi:hypothetical protein